MTKSQHRKEGAKGFGDEYWKINYAEPNTMDGIANAKEHARYLKCLFALEYIDISSIVDLGFGLGKMFKEMLRTFLPYRALGIEPSQFAFEKVKHKNLRPVSSTNLKVEQIDIHSWCLKSSKPKRFDLGLCNSVLQYLSDEEINEVMPILAKRLKYLYLTVPTNKELDRQISDLKFKDVYAIRRSRAKYLKMIRPHFTNVSSRLWESKVYFDESSTSFTDLLYRF